MSNARLETEIRNNINTMDEDTLYDTYGIFLKEDNKIFDEVSQRLYPSVNDWIYDYLNDTGVAFEKFQSALGFDDDYY